MHPLSLCFPQEQPVLLKELFTRMEFVSMKSYLMQTETLTDPNQGLVLNGLKEFLMHNSLGPGDLHFHYTNVRRSIGQRSRSGTD